jgi:hypothetical protein
MNKEATMNRTLSTLRPAAATLVASLLCGAQGFAAVSLFTPADAKVRAGAESSVPLHIQGARDLGALQLDVAFDGELLEAVEVSPGANMPPVLLEHHVVAPGLLRIALAASEPIEGDARLDLRFRGLTAGSSTLSVDDARAWELATGFDLLTDTRPGQVTVTRGPSLTLLLVAVAAAFVLLLLLLLVILLSRRRGKRGETPTRAPSASPPPPSTEPPSPAPAYPLHGSGGGAPPPPPPGTSQGAVHSSLAEPAGTVAPSPPPPPQWYVSRGGERFGPYEGPHLAAMMREGRVLPDDLVWSERLGDWARADSVEGLA